MTKFAYVIYTTDGHSSWTVGEGARNINFDDGRRPTLTTVWEAIQSGYPLVCSNQRPATLAVPLDGVRVVFNPRHVISVAEFPVRS